MKENKLYEVKDKFLGNAKEMTGRVLEDPELELEGKLQKGTGKVRELANDLVSEIDDVKEKVVGTSKEVFGKITSDKDLEFKGRLQRKNVKNPRTNKIIGGLTIIALLYALMNLVKKDSEK